MLKAQCHAHPEAAHKQYDAEKLFKAPGKRGRTHAIAAMPAEGLGGACKGSRRTSIAARRA